VSDTATIVRTVLEEHGRLAVPVDGLQNESDLYAAGLTSHASVNVMLALEDAFDLEFPERLLKKATFSSLGSIVEAIDEIRVDA